MDKTYAQALDATLRMLLINKDDSILVMVIKRYLHENYGIDKDEANLIFKKLIDDEMIIHDRGAIREFTPTFKGNDFDKQYKGHGYERIETRERNKAFYIKITNVFITIGAVATLVIAVIESIKFSERKSLNSLSIPDQNTIHVQDTLNIQPTTTQKDTNQSIEKQVPIFEARRLKIK